MEEIFQRLHYGGMVSHLAKNRSDADAEATFRALAHAASNKKMVADAADQAVWLVEGLYQDQNLLVLSKL